MCRLLLNVGKTLPKDSFFEFILSCEDYPKQKKLDVHERNKNTLFQHADGFGYSILKDGKFETKRFSDPIFKNEEDIYSLISKSSVSLVHARKASPGIEINLSNNHPFKTQFMGKEWVFMHNGTIRSKLEYNTAKFKTEGTTDSEKYFFVLLELIERNGYLSNALITSLIKEWDFSGANFILANNEKVWIGVFYNESPLYYTMKLYASENRITVSSAYLPSLGDAKLLSNETLLEIDLNTLKITEK